MVVLACIVWAATSIVGPDTQVGAARTTRPGASGIGPAGASAGTTSSGTGPLQPGTAACPWLEAAIDSGATPVQLAAAVLRRMTTAEKLGELALVRSGDYENVDSGVPRLCIPSLTLQDGPQGSAFGAEHVTQLPAPLGIAATFDPAIARAYGEVQGSEAAGQGIDVVQGPNLNIDRVPESGRSYEGFGEDPALVSAMGVADIEGIQATGTMALAKHFAVYDQETDRGELDDVVSQRALEEIYLPPFKAAVIDGHVSGLMCAYPELNGVFQCQDGTLLGLLRQWGFDGFVRSDLGSVHDPLAAFAAGTDLVKPADVDRLTPLVGQPGLPAAEIDAAVTAVLSALFAHGLVTRTTTPSPDAAVDTPAHAGLALAAAERSAVLLKDSGGILPLTPTARSVAVIGADAGAAPVTSGFGSSKVVPPFTSTPLSAIRGRAGRGTTVTYADGGSTTRPLPPVPTDLLTPDSGAGHGLTLTLSPSPGDTSAGGQPTGGGPPASSGGVPSRPESIQSAQATVDVSIRAQTPIGQHLPYLTRSPSVERRPPVQPLDSTLHPLAPRPRTRVPVVLPAGWSNATATWTGTLTPPRSGLYTLSLQGGGQASLTLDGSPVVSDTLTHALGRWSQTVPLVAGHPYRVRLLWQPIDTTTPSGESLVVPSSLTLGWQFVGERIAAAVAAAHGAHIAVVFAGDYSSEGFDRPSLSLPGDENALIDAVASANPRTVVVLNTGGPVLMPWLGKVAGVIEDWYPGEQDGTAVAALLFGDADPSGRLPVTFPASEAGGGLGSPAQWPGIDETSDHSEGLAVGYRYEHATGTKPLFPFGYGLSYTRFTLGGFAVARTASGYAITVQVGNRGRVGGTDVPQAYLTFPTAAGEPPAQLVAFAPVDLAPGEKRTVTLSVPASSFEAYLGSGWSTVPGAYTLSVGESSADLPLNATVAAP